MRAIYRRYWLLVLLSLCLHIIFYLGWRLLWESEKTPLRNEKIQINLKTSPQAAKAPAAVPPLPEDAAEPKEQEKQQEEQKKEEEQDETPEPESHAPMSNAEAFASDNQEDDSVTQIDPGDLAAPQQHEDPASNAQAHTNDSGAANQGEKNDTPTQSNDEQAAAHDVVERQIPDYRSVVDAETIDMDAILSQQAPTQTEDPFASSDSNALARALESAENRMEGNQWLTGEDANLSSDQADSLIQDAGNAVLLSEAQLREQIVKSPFSEQREKELRMANKYLDRMSQQVYELWINPYQGTQQLKGIIWMEIDSQGYLVDADIYRTSGDRLLDISVLDAIRAVRRFEVPDDPDIVRKYYTNLRFHYSSLQEQPELMPYQKEQN